MAEIKTNDRFDRLTNLDIKTHYRDIRVCLFPSDFLGPLAYWITKQSPNEALIDVGPALSALEEYILPHFENPGIPTLFTYDSLSEIVHEDVFDTITEIHKLNSLEPDFIDLGALARNVFYMILREQITQQI